jgi:hypothetical protein
MKPARGDVRAAAATAASSKVARNVAVILASKPKPDCEARQLLPRAAKEGWRCLRDVEVLAEMKIRLVPPPRPPVD